MEKKFNVEGMTCQACEMLIEDALGEIGGVKSVKASQKHKSVDVDFDEKKVSEKHIADIIEKEGFEVRR